MDDRLRNIRNDLEQVAALHELERIRSALEEASRYRNHTYSDVIHNLFKKIDDKGEELHWNIINSSTDPGDRMKRIEDYRKEYPLGKFKEEINKLSEDAYDSKGASERQTINMIRPGQAKTSWQSYLQRKAAAVDGYRKEYVSVPSLQEKMESASKLAGILATQSDFDITVKWAEKLSDARPTIVIITVNDKEMFRTESQDNARPNWDKSEKVNWNPGDKIGIEWRYHGGWWLDGPIAVQESNDLDSLKILSGLLELNPSEKQEYLSPEKKPQLSLSIEGIDNDIWAIFHEFIYPGGYWSK